MGQGIVKHLAERQEADIDRITRREILTTSLLLQLTLGIVVIGGILLFQTLIANWVFGEIQANNYVIVAALSVPLMLLFINFGYFLQGTSQVTKFSLASVVNVIAGLLVFVWLIRFYGLDGAILSLLTSAFISIVIFGWFSRKKLVEIWQERENNLTEIFSSRVAKILMLYGIVTFISGFLETSSALILRSWIINISGAAENGIYQAVVSLSGQYIGFFTLFNTTYLFPKMSNLRDGKEIVIETNKALQLGAVCLTPMLVVILIFKEQIILLLFTPAFLTASGILIWQVLGDFIKISSWSISASLLPTGKLREYVILSVFYSGLSLILSITFLYRWQTVGLAIAHFWTYVVFFVLVVAIQKRVLGLKFSALTIRLLAFSAFMLLFMAFFPNKTVFDYILKIIILLIWCSYAVWEMRFYLHNIYLNNRFVSKIRK